MNHALRRLRWNGKVEMLCKWTKNVTLPLNVGNRIFLRDRWMKIFEENGGRAKTEMQQKIVSFFIAFL